MSFKSKAETIKEWWDDLDNTELLTWDFFEKNAKPIVESLPASKYSTKLNTCSELNTQAPNHKLNEVYQSVAHKTHTFEL